jgi:hypothetical protein
MKKLALTVTEGRVMIQREATEMAGSVKPSQSV